MSLFDFTPVLANRIISVITIDRAEDAEPLTQALLDGGLNALEVTFRTPASAAWTTCSPVRSVPTPR